MSARTARVTCEGTRIHQPSGHSGTHLTSRPVATSHDSHLPSTAGACSPVRRRVQWSPTPGGRAGAPAAGSAGLAVRPGPPSPRPRRLHVHAIMHRRRTEAGRRCVVLGADRDKDRVRPSSWTIAGACLCLVAGESSTSVLRWWWMVTRTDPSRLHLALSCRLVCLTVSPLHDHHAVY